MKVLQVSLKPPYPKADGGCMAIAAMTEMMLQADHDVKLLTMSTHKHPFDKTLVPKHILEATSMEAVKLDTRVNPFDAFLNLFSSESYNISRFYSKAFENKLIDILDTEDFDVIHLESIFCTPYLKSIREKSTAKVIFRAHNVEFQIWEQLAIQEKNPLKKWYLNLLASRLKNYETEILNSVDGFVTITEDDANTFESLGIRIPMQSIPIGIDISKIEADPLRTDKLHLYHLGAMDWLPNTEGINWFVDDIWPILREEFPEICCSLAGRNMPIELMSKSSETLNIEGEISSAAEFISDKNIAIVPLLSGSGLRVKIVEALAHGKVVLTTSLGATGIPFEDGKNILIADSPNDFVEQIRKLQSNPQLITSIGNEARKLAERQFDLSTLSSKLTYFYENL